ncbi:stromelysin-3 isoform X1 [Phoca vitulina]|uniref:stromelysin-3 isoform X1 n=1 Tax=Phoca vitulina TaxID=9720 RepID=UPI00139634DA|nr:stromelysin-3 isoform X1 [Phoca vitulina]
MRKGPQPRHEAAPGSLAPAPTAQETPQPASTPRPPRCGVPDPPEGLSARNRQKRFVLSGGRWEKTDLTYRYWHGDNLPFDGPGGILAHAFFPKTHREGDVHFDYDETWTIGNNQGTDLLQVAAHEFGHVLGLQHTMAAKALMSPFYTFRYPLSLSPDDRRGIQHLYGRPWPAPTSSPPAVGPQAGVDTNEIAPLEVRLCSQLPSPSGLRGSDVGSFLALLSHASRKPPQMPARLPLMRSLPSVASSSSSRRASCGGCVGAGCSLATPHWLLVTGRDCPAPWMQPLKMPRATSGSSKVLSTGCTMARSQSWALHPSLSWACWGPPSRPPWPGAPRRTRSTSSEAETTGASTSAPAEWTAPCPAGPLTGEGCPLRSTPPSGMLTVRWGGEAGMSGARATSPTRWWLGLSSSSQVLCPVLSPSPLLLAPGQCYAPMLQMGRLRARVITGKIITAAC